MGKKIEFLFAFIFIQGVSAADYVMKPECQENQAAFNQCGKEYFEFYDAELNRLYNAKMSLLSGEEKHKQNLKNAQLAWIKFRDADCRYITGSPDEPHGSGWDWLYYSCLGDRTKERAYRLGKYLGCDGYECTRTNP